MFEFDLYSLNPDVPQDIAQDIIKSSLLKLTKMLLSFEIKTAEVVGTLVSAFQLYFLCVKGGEITVEMEDVRRRGEPRLELIKVVKKGLKEHGLTNEDASLGKAEKLFW